MPGKQVIRSLLLDGSCLRFSRTITPRHRPVRFLSSTSKASIAAPAIDFSNLPPPDTTNARLVPVSPSYFAPFPGYTDDLILINSLQKHFSRLPTLTGAAVPRVTWKTRAQYEELVQCDVPPSKYQKVLEILRQLNRIHPAVRPQEVKDVIESHRRDIDPHANQARPVYLDEHGRAYANGRRKTGRANVWLVEGEGEVIINGKNLAEAFGRIHDRESALWALKVTNRLDKYNVFATMHGGGITGQAESLALALARALMVHEPALKPALRRAGVVTRDPRKVERKKPGHVKARKMPAWVKR